MSTSIFSGGIELVHSGGVAVDTLVFSGGILDVLSGGLADATTIFGGGTETVSAGGIDGGIDNGAQISGGTQFVYGLAIDAAVLAGAVQGVGFTGLQLVEAGGIASGTVVSSGGEEVVNAGGIAVSTTIDFDGFEVVSSGGTTSATIINGGTLEVTSGGSTGSEPVSFTIAGGDLQLDASQSFGGLIAGFASPSGVTEEIDLRDISFGPGTRAHFVEAPDHLSGTLTVRDGTQVATLTLLGQYTTHDFTLSSDGQGGTLVTDPPSSSASAANLLLAAHT